MMEGSQENRNFWRILANAGPGERFSLIVSSWFLCGLLPGAPGTFGTAAAVIVAFLTGTLPMAYRALILVGIIVLAMLTSSVSASALGKEDPSEVVIDEVAGYLVAVFALPVSLVNFVLAFIFFRAFDILKPFPIAQVEKKVRGGIGIVLDDLLAGLFTFAVVKLILISIGGSLK